MYYKVVRVAGDKLKSVWVRGNAEVEYKVGKWSTMTPKAKEFGQGLLVFANKNQAEEFAMINNGRRHSDIEPWENKIFECEVQDEMSTPEDVNDLMHEIELMYSNGLETFEKYVDNEYNRMDEQGVLCFGKVKLLKEIK